MDVTALENLIDVSNCELSRTRKATHRGNLRATGEIEVSLDDFQSVSLSELAGLADAILADEPTFQGVSYYFARALDALSPSFYVDCSRNESIRLEVGVVNAIAYPIEDVRSIISLSMTAVSATLESVDLSGESGEPMWVIYLRLNDSRVSVGVIADKLAQLASSVGVLRGSRNVDHIGQVLHRIRSGLHDQLIGEAESAWLDFKSRIDFESEAARIELAQDVARFANSEHSGLLIVGFRTERRGGDDVAVKLTPVESSRNPPKRYEDVIDGRVYPSIRGLTVERISITDDRSVILIQIPAQREEDKPFLVHGVIVQGKTEGAFFSIVRRRGEGSVPVTARELHAYISAGRRIASLHPSLQGDRARPPEG